MIGQNTEKNSGDLRRLINAQTTLKYHYIMQVWKNSQKNNDYNKNDDN